MKCLPSQVTSALNTCIFTLLTPQTDVRIFNRVFSTSGLYVYVSDGPPGRSRGGCMRCQQSRSLQLAIKVLYGFVAFLVVTVVVLASLGEPSLA